MLQKVLSIIVIVSLVLAGCMLSAPSAEKVLKKMEDASGYSSEARMAVKNNRSVFYYNLKQYYKKPDKFRIEFYDDNLVMKQIMIYNNGQCGIFHVGIDKPFKSDTFAGTKEHNSFLSAFLENYRNAPDAKWTVEEKDGRDYYVFQCSVAGNNPYFKKALLYVNPKNAQPLLLNVFAEDDSKTLEVEYKTFLYGTETDDSLFDIEEQKFS